MTDFYSVSAYMDKAGGKNDLLMIKMILQSLVWAALGGLDGL
jgi:hypothetical protein